MNSRSKLLTAFVLTVLCASSVAMFCTSESDAAVEINGSGTPQDPYTKFYFSQFDITQQEIYETVSGFNGKYFLLGGSYGIYENFDFSFSNKVNCTISGPMAYYKQWNIGLNIEGDASFTMTYGGQSIDMVLHVISEPINNHTVSFSSNGSVIQTQTVDDGMTASSFNPTLDGYTFKGWYVDGAFSSLFDFSTPITSDKTLYAKWEGNFAFTSEPTAEGTITNISSMNGTVVFDASASEGSIIVWDFGDGSTATGMYQTHYYAEPGTYSVKLFVYNDNGDVDMKEYSISIPDVAVGGGGFDVRHLVIVLICILGGGLVIRRIL